MNSPNSSNKYESVWEGDVYPVIRRIFNQNDETVGFKVPSTFNNFETHKPSIIDLDDLINQTANINQKISQANDCNELQSLLGQKTELIEDYIKQHSKALEEEITKASALARRQINHNPDDERTFQEAVRLLLDDLPSSALREIKRRSLSLQAEQQMLLALDAEVIERLKNILDEMTSKKNVRGIDYILSVASAPATKQKIKEALDFYVLYHAKELLSNNISRPFECMYMINTNSSSDKIKMLMKEALELIMFKEAWDCHKNGESLQTRYCCIEMTENTSQKTKELLGLI